MGSTFTFVSHTDETKHVSVEIIIKSVATKTFSQNRKLHKTMYMYLWFPGPNSSYDITHSFFFETLTYFSFTERNTFSVKRKFV